MEQQNISLSRDPGIALAVVSIFAFFLGTIGNATVLALFIKYKSLRTSSNTFVINLAVPDFLMCLLCLPMLTHYFIRNDLDSDIVIWFCRINNFFGAFTGFLSIWSLVCLAFDRCIVIKRSLPIRYSSDKVIANYVITAIWICSLLCAAFPLCGYGRLSIEGLTNSCDVSDKFRKSAENMLYNISIQVLFFLIPIICIASCYYVIFMKVRQHEKIYFSVRESGQYDEVSFRRMRKSRTLERCELKTAKVALMLITVFCLAWTPYSVVSWIGLVGKREWLTPLMIAIPAMFAKILTVLNPILYALSLQSFKSKLKLCWKQYFKTETASFVSIDRSFPLTAGACNLHNTCYVPRTCDIPNMCNIDRTCNTTDGIALPTACSIPKTYTMPIPNIQHSTGVNEESKDNKIATTAL